MGSGHQAEIISSDSILMLKSFNQVELSWGLTELKKEHFLLLRPRFEQIKNTSWPSVSRPQLSMGSSPGWVGKGLHSPNLSLLRASE